MAEFAKNKGYLKKGTTQYSVGTPLLGINIAPTVPIPIFQITTFNDSESITLVSTTQIRLTAGKKYKLTGELSVIMTSVSGLLAQFYNVTTSSYVGDTLRLTPSTDANNSCITSFAALFISPNVDTILEFRCTSGTIADMYSGSKVIIEEVEAYLPIVPNTTKAIMSGQIGTAGLVDPGIIPFDEFWVSRGITYNATTRRFTVPVAGDYRITMNPFKTNAASGTRVRIGVNTDLPDEITHKGMCYSNAVNTYDTMNINSIVTLNSGDYIVFYLAEGQLYNEAINKSNQFSIELLT